VVSGEPAHDAWAPPSSATTGAQLVLLAEDAGREGLAAVQGIAGAATTVLPRLGVAVVRASPDGRRALVAAAADPRVAVAATEPDRVLSALDAPAPGAPVGDSRAATWGLRAIGVTRQRRLSGLGVRLAVLDSGIDLGHPDFAGRTMPQQSFVDGVGIQDGFGHGTHCAGTACGPRKPGTGPRYGVAPDAELHIGRVLDDTGHGSDSSFLAALEWAVGAGCRIVSASLGQRVAPGTPFSQVVEQAARRALAAGTLIVGAAGNDSSRPDTVYPVSHPANCPSIVAVGAVADDMAVGSFSNGTAGAGDGRVAIAGPGLDVYSSFPLPIRYRRSNGTSMATPHVSGVAALALQADPGATPGDLRTLLLQRALPLDSPAEQVGAGLVRVR
jgi:hypothetical protein